MNLKTTYKVDFSLVKNLIYIFKVFYERSKSYFF